MKRVEILNDPVFLDILPHFLGIATHDNIDGPPTGTVSLRAGSARVTLLRERAYRVADDTTRSNRAR
ncbi:hypothetical protein [Wenxinia saemankumensis]|uniref:Uncharacterized protein n=1 Tax=Wenxinia saemankumensis TaxID=1447782 RepID=A0A1M6ADQ8_9RHOB|nr:hypothetical protein [Wenxinia saemankumensis]SHI34537.1 hypothetical protein SAMN05444417_0376 [Wenxinia saemankumensis]